MPRRAILAAFVLFAPSVAGAQTPDLLWPFTSGGGFGQQMRASRLNGLGVLQGAAERSSKLNAGAVVQNTAIAGSKVVGYAVLQSTHAAIILHAPLTHW